MKLLLSLIISAQIVFASDVVFKIKKIKIGNKVIMAEIADTEQKRSQGLMFRKSLDPAQGMLFVFENEQDLVFWMKNTFIPLSVGFFNSKKVLVDIQDMEPVKSEIESDLPRYASKKKSKYALEVTKGWFSKNNIKIGDKFVIP